MCQEQKEEEKVRGSYFGKSSVVIVIAGHPAKRRSRTKYDFEAWGHLKDYDEAFEAAVRVNRNRDRCRDVLGATSPGPPDIPRHPRTSPEIPRLEIQSLSSLHFQL